MSLAYQIASALSNGKPERNGDGYTCRCPAHGDKHNSLSIKDDGNGDIIVHCFTGCNWKDIKDCLVNMGLLPEWSPGENGKKYTTQTPPKPKKQDPPKPEKPSFIWKQATRTQEDIVFIEKYLAGRGITMPLPLPIKKNSYKDKESGEIVHMMVAAASRPCDKQVYAVQRIFIDPEDHTKTGAKMHGKCADAGRGVYFDRKGDLSTLLIGEGIENVLSVMQPTNINGVAALSTAGIKNFIFPEETLCAYFLVDSDPVREKFNASMPGQKAAYIAAQKFEASLEGRRAYFVTPDDTCFSCEPAKLDFNDLLQQDPTGSTIKKRFDKAVPFSALDWELPAEQQESGGKEVDEHNDEEAIRAMFDRFVFLASENKIIDSDGHDIKESMMVERAFIVSQAGKDFFYKDQDGNLKSMPLAKYWLSSDEKKVAVATKYKPGEQLLFKNGDGRSYYNTFKMPCANEPGLSIEDRDSRLKVWHKIMSTVFHKHVPYIEDWLSFTLQHPEKRAGIMPICISGVGLGKSLVMNMVSRVVGSHNFSNGKILDVTGLGKSGTQWGDWIFNKKVSCIEEINPEGENNLSYRILDALKDIITNETLPLNLKGGRNGTFKIYSNIIGFSNHRNCIKIPLGDRRLFVVDSLDQELLPFEEYVEMYDLINEQQNITAIYQYLMSREISSEFTPGQAKMTRAKKLLQLDSRNIMQSAFDLVIEQYPCDLLTSGELQLAVSEAITHIDGEDSEYLVERWNASKQFNAIMKTSTTLVAEGKRLRVRRCGGQKLNPSQIRAIRNSQKWASAPVEDIRVEMYMEIPNTWINEDDEETIPF